MAAKTAALMLVLTKKSVVSLFHSFSESMRPQVHEAINACSDDFLQLVLSVLFKVPVANKYHGLKRSPSILKHVIKLVFGLNPDVYLELVDPAEINQQVILDLLLTLETLDPDIIDVDRHFVKSMMEGQKVTKVGRIYFEKFREAAGRLGFYESCRVLRKCSTASLEKHARSVREDFLTLTQCFPELLTYHAVVSRKRHLLFHQKHTENGKGLRLNSKALIRMGYSAIRTYMTVYSIVTKEKQLAARRDVVMRLRGSLLYRTLNAFIIETPEVVERILDSKRLGLIIENVPSFYVAFDAMLARAQEDTKYLAFVDQMLRKYPIKSNIEKVKCLRSQHPAFVESVERHFAAS